MNLHLLPAAHGNLAATIRDGAGTPVVLVPGLDGVGSVYDHALVGVDAPVYALSLRGRGDADHTGPFGVDAHADDVAAVVATFDFPVRLVGHSFGAHVCAEVARRIPDKVEHVVLVDGGTPRRLAPDADRVGVANSVADTIIGHLDAKPYPVAAEAVRADSVSLFCDDTANRAVFEVAVPVVLVRADGGVAPGLPPVVPAEAVAELVDALASFEDHLVVGADHFSVLDAQALAEVLARR